MKKILAIALAICMLASCVLMVYAYPSVTTFEDEGDVSMLGESVNNREKPGAGSGSIYKFRNGMTNSHGLDGSRATNKIVQEEDGNQCVKFDAYEAWVGDHETGDDHDGTYVSIDLKPTTVTGLAGVIVYGNPYDGCTANSLAQVSGYPTTGVGLTIASDCQSVIVFCTPDEETITYTFDTGLDLKAEWHTYAAYVDGSEVTLTIDEKVVATVVSESGVVTIYDNDGNEQASDEGGFYTDDPRCGFMVTGSGMDILGDNLTWTGYESIPTEKFTTLSAHIEVAEDITLYVKANGLPDDAAPQDYSMRFTQDGKTEYLDEERNGNGYFVYEDIKMSRAGDNILVQLLDSEDNVVLETNLSVIDYLNTIIDSEDETYSETAANVARLCSAMNVYAGGEGFIYDETMATEVGSSYTAPEKGFTTYCASENDKITSATLYIDNNINVVFKYKVAAGTKIKVLVNNVETMEITDLTAGKFTIPNDVNFANMAETTFTVVLLNEDDDELSSVRNYSVLEYIEAKFTSETVGDVVKALSVFA